MIKTKKISCKKIAIIILIAVFSIAGIIACSGDAITGGREGNYSYTPDDTYPTNTGPLYTNDIKPPEPGTNDTIPIYTNDIKPPEPGTNDATSTFPENTYREIYVPYVGAKNARGWNYTNVSYQDTETLTALWRGVIMRKGEGDGGENGKKFYLKSPDGDFFFDENLHIRWSKKSGQILKRFCGGVMFKYQGTTSSDKTTGTRNGERTIGGLYTYALHIKDLQKHGVNNTTTRIMFGVKVHRNWELNGAGGRMEVLVLNTGMPMNERGYHHWKAWGSGDWAAQTYLQDDNKGYQDGNYHMNKILGKDPDTYMSHMNSVNNLWYYQIRFSPKNYDMKAR